MDEITKDLPLEFATYVSWVAWQRGHSAGEDEVFTIAKEMVSELLPVINKYTERIVGPPF